MSYVVVGIFLACVMLLESKRLQGWSISSRVIQLVLGSCVSYKFTVRVVELATHRPKVWVEVWTPFGCSMLALAIILAVPSWHFDWFGDQHNQKRVH